jgi:hypothetical protein
MSRQKSSGKVDKRANSLGWHTILADVKAESEKTRKHLAELENSAQILQEKISAREPFPENFLSTQNQHQPTNA